MEDHKAQVFSWEKERSRRLKGPSSVSMLLGSTGVTPQELPEIIGEQVSRLVREVLTGERLPSDSLRHDLPPRTTGKPTQQGQKDILGTVRINFLANKNLKAPIDAILERDGEGFIARTLEMPLYGYGEDPIEAMDTLKREIESLYEDLMEDDNFTDDWLRIKAFLLERIY
jgi:hypothetical protein